MALPSSRGPHNADHTAGHTADRQAGDEGPQALTTRRRALAALGLSGAALAAGVPAQRSTAAQPQRSAAAQLPRSAASPPAPRSAFVSVTDLGAKGDGVTDDTAAVQAAIDRGGITLFPPGDYACRTLTMRKATHLAGTSSGTYTYAGGTYLDDYPVGTVSRIARRPGTNAPLVLGPVGAKRVIIEDLELDGNNARQSAGNAHVVAIADAAAPEDTQWVIDRCYVHGRTDPTNPTWGSGGSNLYIGAGRMACHVTDTVSTYAGYHGFEINGADAVIRSCIAGDNGAQGIVIGAWVTTVTECAIYNNTTGVYIADTGNASPKRIILSANGIDRNRHDGILVDKGSTTGAAGVSIVHNTFTSNSSDTDAMWAHVNVKATTGQIALGGNVFSVLESGYTHRTGVAVLLSSGATALDLGNLYEGGSANGFTNAPGSLYTSTRLV